MKVHRHIILFLIFFAFLVSPQLQALGTASTVIKVGSASLTKGSTANIPVRVENIQSDGGLGAYDIEVSFNPSVVNVLDVVGGDSPFNTVTAKSIDNSAGKVRFNHFIATTQGPTGSITIAYLKIKAVGSAGSSTALTITVHSLVDAKTGEEIPRTTQNGYVTIKVTKTKTKTSLRIELVGGPEFTLNTSVMIRGQLSPQITANIDVKVKWPSGKTTSKTIKTSNDGSFTYNFTASEAGTYYVTAYFYETDKYYGSTSNTITFKVKVKVKVQANLKTFSTIENNTIINITGNVISNGVETPVRLYLSFDNKTWTLYKEKTTSDNFDFNITIPIYGTIYFKIEIPNTQTITGAEKYFSVYIKSPKEIELEVKLSEARKTISQLNAQLEEARQEITTLNSNLKETEKRIHTLESQIQNLKENLDSLNNELNSTRIIMTIGIPTSFIIAIAISYIAFRKLPKTI
ncbi:MAG: emp24/gp25L/p24 family protein [archaeon GB-1867-035]|nr:emp24/gp25L/p24 family protein [Candidatus Culexmicrobium profundum]